LFFHPRFVLSREAGLSLRVLFIVTWQRNAGTGGSIFTKASTLTKGNREL
jgi:hypothetical protein